MVPLWQDMDSHLLCDHKLGSKCFYCLQRSLSLRSMNPQVRTPISPVEVLSCLEEENIDKLAIHEMIKSIMDFLITSEENISKMFKNISMYCKKCGKDIPIQNNEILDLHVLDNTDNLQEILNKHLQNEIDDHCTTYHRYDSKSVELRSAGITSKNQTFLFLALDKNMKIDLESDLLIGGKMFSCISAIKVDRSESYVSTVFRDLTEWSIYDEKYKKQGTVSNDEF